jgi:polysaccharide chain length determinant protein (PEP-CTERM system associated)
VNPHLDKLLDEIRSTWRHRWLALAIACVLAVAGWVLIFMMPDRYEAQASVLVDARTALKPALEGLALQQDVGVELSYVRESLLANPTLLDVAAHVGILPASNTDPVRAERALGVLRKHITLKMQSADDRPEMGFSGGTTYAILYQDTNRPRALEVVTVLLQKLINETLGGKQQGSESAQQFLESQVKDYEKRLRNAEDRLAEFKSRNFGLMPSQQGGYFVELQKETELVEDTKTKVLVAESRRAALEKQLHGDAVINSTAVLALPNSAGAPVGMDTVSRIAQTKAHLDELLNRHARRLPSSRAAVLRRSPASGAAIRPPSYPAGPAPIPSTRVFS